MKKAGSIYALIYFILFLLFPLDIYCQESGSIQPYSESELAEYYFKEGNDYRDKDNIKEAIFSWSKAIKMQPDFIAAYYSRGNAFGREGLLDEAIIDFTKVISDATDKKLKVLAYYNRAVAYGRQDKADEALADYNQAIELDPSYAPAYNNRAVVYLYKKDYNLSWQDVYKTEELGQKVNLEFIEELKRESGRDV
jgi:tetratricopeptide (TPR) repeat protein